MKAYFVVSRRSEWPFETPGVTIVTARDYLGDSGYAETGPARVINLCRTDRYQGRGYYVSLVAQARGHRAAPEVKTIEDVQAGDPASLVAGRTDDPVLWLLNGEANDRIEVRSFFGRDPEGMHDPLACQLFSLLDAPLIRATFERDRGVWALSQVRLLAPPSLDADELAFAAAAAAQHFASDRPRIHETRKPVIALLHNDDEPDPPSNLSALEHFRQAAQSLGMDAEMITRHDGARIRSFDALFIRDTTHVNHYTYQFARRAETEGLVVIDDPASIMKCTNKVYLQELLTRHRIAMPRTIIVHGDNVDQIAATLGFPCIVKQPDSAFSRGVAKVQSKEQLAQVLDDYFARSELVVAQEWLPTEFDWRVGVLDGRALYVCKYLMAPGHWQVVKNEAGRRLEGVTMAMTVGEAPRIVVETAVKAARLIGDGLYGVDLKQVGDRCYVIEVNDNPNIDAGNEDGILKDALYREVMGVFLRRIGERGRAVRA